MFDPKVFEEFAKKFSESLPPGVKDIQSDIEKNTKALLQSAISKLDLVTREEFDVQTKVLSRAIERIEELEKQISSSTKEGEETDKQP